MDAETEATRESGLALYPHRSSEREREPRWNYVQLFRLHLWPLESFSQYFRFQPEATTDYERPEEAEHIATKPTLRKFATSFLSRCLANEEGRHRLCTTSSESWLPTRLLDVEHAQKSGWLRLVHLEQDPAADTRDKRWITLSHCWGTANNPLLRTGNLHARREPGIRIEDLPRTFQDAVQVANWFEGNLEYLLVLVLLLTLHSEVSLDRLLVHYPGLRRRLASGGGHDVQDPQQCLAQYFRGCCPRFSFRSLYAT